MAWTTQRSLGVALCRPSPRLRNPLDHLENCHVGSDIDFRPKLVNGKGLLDNFLRSQVETSIGQAVS